MTTSSFALPGVGHSFGIPVGFYSLLSAGDGWNAEPSSSPFFPFSILPDVVDTKRKLWMTTDVSNSTQLDDCDN
jgi:hypothetical protein